MRNGKNILFLLPATDVSGSSLFFHHFLHYFNGKFENRGKDIYILTNGGEMLPAFSKMALVSKFDLIYNFNFPLRVLFKLKIVNRENIVRKRINQFINKNNIGLVVGNSIAAIEYLRDFYSNDKLQIDLYLHELILLHRIYGELNVADLKRINAFYFLNSHMKGEFEDFYKMPLPESRSKLFPTFFLDESKVLEFSSYKNAKEKTRNEFLNEHGLPSSTFIVGSSGYLKNWKGVDLFIQLANSILHSGETRISNDFLFVWVGVNKKSPDYFLFMDDIKRLGLEKHFLFVEINKKPFDYFILFDVYFMASRSEGLGFAALECVNLNIPVALFRNSGGLAKEMEMHCSDCLVNYYDIEQAKELILKLKNDSVFRKRICLKQAEFVNINFKPENTIDRFIEHLGLNK